MQRRTLTIEDLFPAFATELEALTRSAGRGDLAGQLGRLPVQDRCQCGHPGCAHFFTAPKPAGSYGPGHTNLTLPADRGLIVLDIVNDAVVAVEVLDRPDVKAVLDPYLPPPSMPDTPIPEDALPFLRTCWKPITEARPAALGASKFCGVALIPSGEPWPVCGNCSQPLRLFVQLDSDELPPEARAFGEGILQFFYCTSTDPLCEVDAEAWAPFGESTVARVLSRSAAQSAEHTGAPENALPERAIVGWQPMMDLPNWEEFESLGVTLDDEVSESLSEEGLPRAGDKLLGWPHWIQGLEYPECPTCSAVMELVLQIDSEDNVPHMFGDMGCGHLFLCPKHPQVLGFAWACG